MEKSLEETIKNASLFSSYPMCWVGDEDVTCNTDEEAEILLSDAVRLLQRIDGGKTKLKRFNKVIDADDFFKVKLYLTERLYELRHLK